jgi:hypothetical protein
VTPLLVVVLAVMWIVVLVPPLLRSRAIGRPSSSVGDFRRHLSTLQTQPTVRSPYGAGAQLRPVAAYRAPQAGRPPARRAPAPLAARSAMKQRRQNILVALVGAALLTGVIGFGMGSRLFLTTHLVIDVLLAGYVYLLVQIKKTQQTKSVRYDWSRAA